MYSLAIVSTKLWASFLLIYSAVLAVCGLVKRERRKIIGRMQEIIVSIFVSYLRAEALTVHHEYYRK